MFRYHRVLAGLLAAATVGACGASEQVDTLDNGAKLSQPEIASEPEQQNDVEFTVPVYSVDEALSKELFGISLGDSVEEVRVALLERGFQEPDPETGSQRIPEAAATGINCDYTKRARTKSLCESIGYGQENGWVWNRTADNGDSETVLPLFFIDENREQALMFTRYIREYQTSVGPRNAIAPFAERFGEPTNSAVDSYQASSEYRIQMPVPKGYSRTAVDERSATTPSWQRAVEVSRLVCLKREHRDPAAPRSEACDKVMNGDGSSQRLFSALGSAGGDTQSQNMFLRVHVNSDRLQVEQHGHFLRVAADVFNTETRLLSEIEEKRALTNTDLPVSDDL